MGNSARGGNHGQRVIVGDSLTLSSAPIRKRIKFMYQSDVRRAAEGCVAAVLPAVAIIVVLTLMRPAVSAEHETAGNFG